jgi:hypothetical protein
MERLLLSMRRVSDNRTYIQFGTEFNIVLNDSDMLAIAHTILKVLVVDRHPDKQLEELSGSCPNSLQMDAAQESTQRPLGSLPQPAPHYRQTGAEDKTKSEFHRPRNAVNLFYVTSCKDTWPHVPRPKD